MVKLPSLPLGSTGLETKGRADIEDPSGSMDRRVGRGALEREELSADLHKCAHPILHEERKLKVYWHRRPP